MKETMMDIFTFKFKAKIPTLSAKTNVYDTHSELILNSYVTNYKNKCK